MANVIKINGKDIKDVKATQDIADLKSQLSDINGNIFISEQKSLSGETWEGIGFTDWKTVKYADGALQALNGKYSDFIRVFPGDVITYSIEKVGGTTAKIAAYSSDDYSSYIQSASVAPESTATSYTVPDGVNYIVISRKRSTSDSITITIHKLLKTDYETFKASVPGLLALKADKTEVAAVYNSITADEAIRCARLNRNEGKNLFDYFTFGNTYRIGDVFTIKSATPNYFPYANLYSVCPESASSDLYVYVEAAQGEVTVQVRIAPGPYDTASKIIDSTYSNGFYIAKIDSGDISSTNNTVILRISSQKSYDVTIKKPYVRLANSLNVGKQYKTAYVAATGSDANTGEEGSPFATINRALESGATNVVISSGKYYQRIDLAKSESGFVRLLNGTAGGRVMIYDPNSVITTSETKETGYTKVYSASCSRLLNGATRFAANNKWLYQDMVDDASTEVIATEIHSLQRGKTYRCEDTKIIKCTATAKADALTEIDNSAEYKWFFDADNEIIYFSRPQTISADHPLCGSFWGTLFLNNSRRNTIEAFGIESKYQSFNLDYTNGALIHDCLASNAYQEGCFTFKSAIGIKLIRCEATRANNGDAGDGFNGQSVANTDAFAKNLAIEMVDCWSHDNNDDGYSNHSRSETIIRGGLFEYNGKSGLTPSYGDHCICYNILSRKNWSGFICTGDPDDEGNCTSMICYDCIAEDNVINGKPYGSGFVGTSSANVVVILVNCKSIGHTMEGSNRGYGYLALNGTMKLIDCRSAGNSHDAGGAGTLTISNTTLVTA